MPQVPGAAIVAADDSDSAKANGNHGSVEEVEEIVTDEPRKEIVADKADDEAKNKPEEAIQHKTIENMETVELRPADAAQPENGDEVDQNVFRDSVSIADRRKLYEFRSMSIQEEKSSGSPTPLRRRNSLKQANGNKTIEEVPVTAEVSAATASLPAVTAAAAESSSNGKRTSTVFGRVSKFRHLKGTPGHKSTQIDNVRNVSRQIPGECDGFQANHERVAVPLAGPGGKIAIYELSKTGRLPDGVIPSLVNGSNIMDFQWDPFDPRRLAVACDDGIVKFWTIPEDGLKEPTNTPDYELMAHTDKIYFIRFHPCAKDVLLTASYDMTMKVWNVLDGQEERIRLTGHSDQIFSFAWSPCGRFGATVCRDGRVRIYEPRKSSAPIAEGTGPAGTRGARIVWAIDGEYLVVTGFDK